MEGENGSGDSNGEEGVKGEEVAGLPREPGVLRPRVDDGCDEEPDENYVDGLPPVRAQGEGVPNAPAAYPRGGPERANGDENHERRGKNATDPWLGARHAKELPEHGADQQVHALGERRGGRRAGARGRKKTVGRAEGDGRR